MIRRTLAFAAALLATGTAAFAQLVPGAIQISGDITASTTWLANNAYQLDGTVKVQNGATLTIEPGTIIYGNPQTTRSCLQIERGGKIYAQGSATSPIIFTSPKAQGSKAPGDWGGIIILGRATNNIPGGVGTIEGGTNGQHGGTDDADSSGVLSYVRIEYAGIAFSTNNEINSLTMGSVGNRTKIDHVMCSYGNDDSFEWFGGTVNATHLIAFAGIDDDWDTDNGFRGRIQFAFGLRDATKFDVSQSNGMEADNDATGSNNTPLSRPIISNLTEVGPQCDTTTVVNALFRRGGHWRRNTRYGLFNSIITGWPNNTSLPAASLHVDALTGIASPQANDLKMRNTTVTGSRAQLPFSVLGTGTSSQTAVNDWFNSAGHGNVWAGDHSGAGLAAVCQANLNNPDPRPASTGSTDFSDGMLATGNNFTFQNVNYRGAFAPSPAVRWDAGWANYNPNSTSYMKHKLGWNMTSLAADVANKNKDAVYPNAVSNAFRFNNGYAVDNELDLKVGYWINLGNATTVEQTGATVNLPQTINVVAGWNLISPGSSQYAPVASISASGTTILSSFFGFNNGYQAVPAGGSLAPGYAYWVNVSGPGTITFNP